MTIRAASVVRRPSGASARAPRAARRRGSRRPLPTTSIWAIASVSPFASVYCLVSRRTISSAEMPVTSEPASNISPPNSMASTRNALSRKSTTARSRSVVVGELRSTVSESTAASSIAAAGALGSIPFWRKRSTTSVAVEPTGSKVARTGIRVSIEPMWWWSRISTISASSTPGTLCACSAWSTSSTRRGRGETRSERVTSPTGLPARSTATAAR